MRWVRLFCATEKPLPDEAEMGAANDLQRHDSRWWRGGVKVEVIADVLGVFVKGPGDVEIAAGTQRAELEDGLGTAQSPAGAGDVHAVLDQVTAGALNDAGGDGGRLALAVERDPRLPDVLEPEGLFEHLLD